MQFGREIFEKWRLQKWNIKLIRYLEGMQFINFNYFRIYNLFSPLISLDTIFFWLKKPGGEKNAFGLWGFTSSTYMNLKTELSEVIIDQR